MAKSKQISNISDLIHQHYGAYWVKNEVWIEKIFIFY